MLTFDKKGTLKELATAGAKQGLIAALDVGTSKISCFIAKVENTGADKDLPLKVVGFGHQVSHGLRKGAVHDLDATEDCIRSTVEAAERMAGATIKQVVVTLTAGAPQSQAINVAGPLDGHPVDDEILRELLVYGRRQHSPEGRTIVHAIPTGYSVDDTRGVRDPRGMYGQRLSARMHMVSALTPQIRNLAVCIERCHLEMAGLVIAPYASGLACLVEDELQLGAICIDLGGGTTSFGVFGDGNCLYAGVVPIGGCHVTNDIARGLSTPLASAERMKTLYGSALASPTDDREMIDVPMVGEDDDPNTANRVARSELMRIIQPRLEETFEIVRDRLQASGVEESVAKRVVLTGGASQLAGIRELAARILQRNVRLGRPSRLNGMADISTGPAFSACTGLLRYTATAPAEAVIANFDSKKESDDNQGRVKKISRWFKVNF